MRNLRESDMFFGENPLKHLQDSFVNMGAGADQPPREINYGQGADHPYEQPLEALARNAETFNPGGGGVLNEKQIQRLIKLGITVGDDDIPR